MANSELLQAPIGFFLLCYKRHIGGIIVGPVALMLACLIADELECMPVLPLW